VTNSALLQVEFNHLSLAETVRLLETVDVFVGYHGGAFDNVPFLPRGAYVIEIMPNGSVHEPLYANRAMTTGKFFIRWVHVGVLLLQACVHTAYLPCRYTNNDKSREQCARPDRKCSAHDLDLNVDLLAMSKLIAPVLEVQKMQLRRY
jgi:hypothetical protein